MYTKCRLSDLPHAVLPLHVSLHARVVQHEVDHLNGILYTSRLAHKNAFGFEKEITTYWKNEQNRK